MNQKALEILSTPKHGLRIVPKLDVLFEKEVEAHIRLIGHGNTGLTPFQLPLRAVPHAMLKEHYCTLAGVPDSLKPWYSKAAEDASFSYCSRIFHGVICQKEDDIACLEREAKHTVVQFHKQAVSVYDLLFAYCSLHVIREYVDSYANRLMTSQVRTVIGRMIITYARLLKFHLNETYRIGDGQALNLHGKYQRYVRGSKQPYTVYQVYSDQVDGVEFQQEDADIIQTAINNIA